MEGIKPMLLANAHIMIRLHFLPILKGIFMGNNFYSISKPPIARHSSTIVLSISLSSCIHG